MISKPRVTILVKASPQPSKRHNETVCCAGLTESGEWKRLFPIRFRHLSEDKAFKRWNVVKFNYGPPKDDLRKESCKVHEESISIEGNVKKVKEKSALIERALLGSEKEAIARNDSLAVVRPNNVSLKWERLTSSQLDSDRRKFQENAAQMSLLDEDIAAYEPCPFKFTLSYVDADGPHNKTCADWETTAAFFNLRKQMSEIDVLRHLERTYCEDYVQTGLVLALGNMKRRPQTWQLLGLLPVKPTEQPDLFAGL